MSGLTGIPADAAAFYAELADHNTREWWAANKGRYEKGVRGPILQLTDALAEEFGEAKVFRPHRDVRFSADKAPYKDRQGAIAQVADGMGFYVQLGREGLATGGGYHHHASDQVARYRLAVDDDTTGRELHRLMDTLRRRAFRSVATGSRPAPRALPRITPGSSCSATRASSPGATTGRRRG